MADQPEVDIRGGGVVAVDTGTLRAAGERFVLVAAELDDIAALLGAAGGRLFALGHDGWDLANEVEQVRRLVRQSIDRAGRFDRELCQAAAVYEMVELHAERSVAEAEGDTSRVSVIDARVGALRRDHPGADEAAAAESWWRGMLWPAELVDQVRLSQLWVPGVGAAAGLGTMSLWQGLRAVGAGTIPAGTTLGPGDDRVRVPVVSRTLVGAAPPTLAAAAARIPGGDGAARIRVEKYAMPDGSRQFAVYVAGTRSVDTHGGRDAFDMTSNLQLYGGARSSSYEATVQALRRSGAQPGDVVHEFGHSQGAMVAAHVALEAGYDTRTLVSFGSPVDADVGPDTLSVTLRHTDDPVAALAGGGHAESVGAPGSFIAERVADPEPGWQDVRLAAHGIDGYTETARVLDSSSDPRMDPVRAMFAELGTATSVETVHYGAERPERDATPVPAPVTTRDPMPISGWFPPAPDPVGKTDP